MTTTREVWGPTMPSKLSSNGPRKARTAAVFSGGAKGIRTPDPHTASVVRYQLRHSPRSALRNYTTASSASKPQLMSTRAAARP